jgi:hypothetical protein
VVFFTAVPVEILYEEAFRSGISFRRKRRTIIVQEGKLPLLTSHKGTTTVRNIDEHL